MQKYECKNCGAELYWNPTTGALTCDYCGESYSVSDFEDTTVKESVDNDNKVDKEFANSVTTDNQTIYKCDECGAEIVAMNTTMATECPYCGRSITILGTHTNGFRPELIVPYRIEKSTAIERVKEFLKKSPFAPKKFVTYASVDTIKGLYIPYFLHTFKLSDDAMYECENITSERNGDDRVETHEVYHVYLKADTPFNRLPVDGSKVLDDKIISALEPFDFGQVKDYNPAYMSGYYAEQPDETKESTKQRAIDRAQTALSEHYLTLLDKYEQRLSKDRNVRVHYKDAEYAMLPIWRLNVLYNDKMYSYDVNGQTGEVTGKVPISIPKVGILSGIVTLLTFVINLLL